MIDIELTRRLSPHEIDAVLGVVAAAAAADTTAPLGEHVLLHLRHGGDEPTVHVVARDGARIVGYAHLDITDSVEGPSAELVVAPDARGHGVGHALVSTLVDHAGNGLRLWAHGQHPAAAALAQRHGFEVHRVLWQMRRSLVAPLPEPALPADVTIRTFQPGIDDSAWLDANARAFADLPDQAGWDAADLGARLGEPWFDPTGFFLAQRAGALVGFHWTKVHGGSVRHTHEHDHDGASTPHVHTHDHEPLGEVYVVGVLPSERGTGLGRALTVLGLRHLRSLGLGQAMLYVDEANTPAIGLYRSLGFSQWDLDVGYRRHTPGGVRS